MKIKKFGYVVMALMFSLGLHSCSDTLDVSDADKYPILFGNLGTKAVADLDDLKENGFKVYAYFKGNVGSSTFEKDVTYKSNQSIWSYEPLEYWIPNTEYWFKAFYPQNPIAGTLTVDNTNKEQNFTITGFDVVNHQEDIMMATANSKVEDGTFPVGGNVVNLKFDHLLANIEIKIKSGISGITINSIVIENADNIGNYSSTGGWTTTDTGDIPFESGVSLNVGDDYKAVTGDGILVIPSSPSGKTLVINASNKTYRVEFPPNIEWTMGNKYGYTLEIKPSDIIFNEPKVEKWDSENATGSVIIK